jgi:hypothetical protein
MRANTILRSILEKGGEQMKTREILSAFGLSLRRRRDCFGQWFIAESEDFKLEAKSVHELLETIVPPPPVIRTPGSIRAWAEECIAAVHFKAEVDPDKLAKASFAAYKLIPSEAELEAFVNACRVDRRRLMERRG